MSRWARLARLGFETYDEYLDSDHWKGVRRRYRKSGRSMDCICGEPSNALHHQTYERLGEEELDDLVPLCNRCHSMVHDLERRGVSGLDVSALKDAAQAAIYEEQTREARKTAKRESRGRGWAYVEPRGPISWMGRQLQAIELAYHAGRLDEWETRQYHAIVRRIEAAERKLGILPPEPPDEDDDLEAA